MKVLTAEQMREADRLTTDRYGIPSLQLMENAGAAVADYLSDTFPDLSTRSIVVLCGKGNNGGDGLVRRGSFSLRNHPRFAAMPQRTCIFGKREAENCTP